jgi:hypothetical protein
VQDGSSDGTGLIERVAAFDIGKADLVACVRVRHESMPGRRVQQGRTFPTTVRGMLELRDWARCWRARIARSSSGNRWMSRSSAAMRAGFDIASLADSAGVSAKSVERWIRGDVVPYPRTRYRRVAGDAVAQASVP